MVAGGATQARESAVPERSLPPVAELATGSMALVVVGGIYMASYVSRSVPLLPAMALLAVTGAILVVDVVMLARVHPFAWERFFQVFKWTLLAYTVIAGMIGYAFVVDGTRGSVLLVLLLMLVVFAVDIPLLLAFSVARYAEIDSRQE